MPKTCKTSKTNKPSRRVLNRSALAGKGKLFSKGGDNRLTRKPAREDKKHASRCPDLKDARKLNLGNLKDENAWYYQAGAGVRGQRYYLTIREEGYLVLKLKGEKSHPALLNFVEDWFGDKAWHFGSASRLATWVSKHHTDNMGLLNKPRALNQIRHAQTKDNLENVLDRFDIVLCFQLKLLHYRDEWSLAIEGKVFFFAFTVEGWTVPTGYTAECSGGKVGAPVLEEAYVASLTKKFGSSAWHFQSPCCFGKHAHKFTTKKALKPSKGWKVAMCKKFRQQDGTSLATVLETQQKLRKPAKEEAAAVAAAKVEVSQRPAKKGAAAVAAAKAEVSLAIFDALGKDKKPAASVGDTTGNTLKRGLSFEPINSELLELPFFEDDELRDEDIDLTLLDDIFPIMAMSHEVIMTENAQNFSEGINSLLPFNEDLFRYGH